MSSGPPPAKGGMLHMQLPLPLSRIKIFLRDGG